MLGFMLCRGGEQQHDANNGQATLAFDLGVMGLQAQHHLQWPTSQCSGGIELVDPTMRQDLLEGS